MSLQEKLTTHPIEVTINQHQRSKKKFDRREKLFRRKSRIFERMTQVASTGSPCYSRSLNRALLKQICNSDLGSQFTNPQYKQLLLAHDVRISMVSKGRALDNIFTERLWRTDKYEEVYVKEYVCPREAQADLTDYLRFYNEERLHQSLEYRTPAEVCFGK